MVEGDLESRSPCSQSIIFPTTGSWTEREGLANLANKLSWLTGVQNQPRTFVIPSSAPSLLPHSSLHQREELAQCQSMSCCGWRTRTQISPLLVQHLSHHSWLALEREELGQCQPMRCCGWKRIVISLFLVQNLPTNPDWFLGWEGGTGPKSIKLLWLKKDPDLLTPTSGPSPPLLIGFWALREGLAQSEPMSFCGWRRSRT